MMLNEVNYGSQSNPEIQEMTKAVITKLTSELRGMIGSDKSLDSLVDTMDNIPSHTKFTRVYDNIYIRFKGREEKSRVPYVASTTYGKATLRDGTEINIYTINIPIVDRWLDEYGTLANWYKVVIQSIAHEVTHVYQFLKRNEKGDESVPKSTTSLSNIDYLKTGKELDAFIATSIDEMRDVDNKLIIKGINKMDSEFTKRNKAFTNILKQSPTIKWYEKTVFKQRPDLRKYFLSKLSNWFLSEKWLELKRLLG